TAAGQEVALVIVIQSIHPEYLGFKPSTTAAQRWWYLASKRARLEMDNLFQRRESYIAGRIRQAWKLFWTRTAIAYDGLTGNRPADPSLLSKLYIYEALSIEHKKAMLKYRPLPYRG